jgi:hypothetical protein
MIEPAIAFTLFDKVLSALGFIREGQKRRTEKVDQALFALYAALGESRSYLNDRASGKRRNREREFAIAKLWHSASVPLREIDPELSERCFIKGGYWMEPDAWDKKRIQEKGIAFEAVFEATRQLLVR